MRAIFALAMAGVSIGAFIFSAISLIIFLVERFT